MVKLLMSKDEVLQCQTAMLFNAVASFTAGLYDFLYFFVKSIAYRYFILFRKIPRKHLSWTLTVVFKIQTVVLHIEN